MVEALDHASYYAFVVGPEDDPEWLRAEIDFALNRWARREGSRIAILLLPDTGVEHLDELGDGVERLALPGEARERAEELESWARSLGKRAESPLLMTRDICPLPGLEPFDEGNARFFFGRGDEVLASCQQMGVARHRRKRWLQIEGASGAGKSSLARAGLVPAIRRGWIKGVGDGWSVMIFRPGKDPIGSLAAALVSVFREQDVAVDSDIERRLRLDSAALRDLLRALNGGNVRGCLLVVDQLEELFTLMPKESPLCGQFDDLLATALDDREGPLFLVTTIRNDFIPHFASLPKLAKKLNDEAARHHLSRLPREELREVICAPIRLAGLSWQDEALVRRLVDAVDEAGGSLPLFSYTLSRLWQERSDDGTLLAAVYDRLGGLGGALAKGADDTIEMIAGLVEASQDAIKALFLSLVRVSVGDPVTRRVRTRAQAVVAAGGGEKGERLLTVLAGGRVDGGSATTMSRLIIVSRHQQPEGAEDRVELAHEELLGGWKTLAGWIEDHRDGLVLREQLEKRVEMWEEFEAKDSESRCYPGSGDAGLLNAGLLDHYRGVVTPDEVTHRFLSQSRFCVQLEQARADNDRLRGLESEVEALWPALPGKVLDLERWLSDTDEHLDHRTQHLANRERIRARGRLSAGGVPRPAGQAPRVHKQGPLPMLLPSAHRHRFSPPDSKPTGHGPNRPK